LFVPVVGGLVFKRAGASHALVAIACGIGTLLAVYFGTDRRGWWDPGTWGLAASATGFAVMLMTRRS
jgi:Trk-type K+ transport system membrane component